jgi:hypothetical protein
MTEGRVIRQRLSARDSLATSRTVLDSASEVAKLSRDRTDFGVGFVLEMIQASNELALSILTGTLGGGENEPNDLTEGRAFNHEHSQAVTGCRRIINTLPAQRMGAGIDFRHGARRAGVTARHDCHASGQMKPPAGAGVDQGLVARIHERSETWRKLNLISGHNTRKKLLYLVCSTANPRYFPSAGARFRLRSIHAHPP